MGQEPSNSELLAAIRATEEALKGVQEATSLYSARTDAKIDGLSRDVAVMKSDITVLKYDVGVLKDDMRDVKDWTKRTDVRLDRLEERRGRKR